MISTRAYDHGTDLDRCMAIWRRASEVGHPFLPAEFLDADEALVRDVYMPAADIRVAVCDGRIVGFIALLDRFIGGLFVAPERHGEGVGRRLVEEAAARVGSLAVEVYDANLPARRFYARLGFVEAGSRNTDDQGRAFPLVTMTRPIPSTADD